jgi:hypothetical protein
MRSFRATIAGPLRELAPYAAIGLIVPGGSLIALAMWAYRHRSRAAGQLGRGRNESGRSDGTDA